jgi:hypothetical protein
MFLKAVSASISTASTPYACTQELYLELKITFQLTSDDEPLILPIILHLPPTVICLGTIHQLPQLHPHLLYHHPSN